MDSTTSENAAGELGLDAVRNWLMVLIAMIAAMVVVGGATRMTGSGLSMVDWHPLMGAIPPLDQAGWNDVFSRYQTSPQYQQVNAWMTLADFKRIFLWEYGHRLLGRLLGLVFFFPWIVFIYRKQLRGRRIWQSGIGFLLGALQGVLGWYMVQSGLVDRPEVSHLRLASHLGLAFFTALYLLWLWLDWAPTRAGPRHRSMVRWLTALVALLALQVLYGAFMAGLRAGLISNTFPLMLGHLFPTHLLAEGSFAQTYIHGPLGVHLIHRMLGWAVLALALVCAWLGRQRSATDQQRRRCNWLAVLVLVQFASGVLTVLTSVAVPVALIHQIGALALLCSTLVCLHGFRGGPTPQ